MRNGIHVTQKQEREKRETNKNNKGTAANSIK